jgi:hypothetical protein
VQEHRRADTLPSQRRDLSVDLMRADTQGVQLPPGGDTAQLGQG